MSKQNGEKGQKNQIDSDKRAAASKPPKRISKGKDKPHSPQNPRQRQDEPLKNPRQRQDEPLKNPRQRQDTTHLPNNTRTNQDMVNRQTNISQNSNASHSVKNANNGTPTKPIRKVKEPKRVTHKMARRRRLIKSVATITVSCILLVVCIAMSLKLLFIVRTVEVSGSELFSSEDITAFCAIPLEVNIFSVNTKEIEKKISQEFTYLEDVKVQKKLPDKIDISLTDSVESYYTLSEEKIAIYSQSFKFLRTGDTVPSDMICLNFDMQNKEVLDIAVKLIDFFKLYEVEKMTGLTILNTSDIRAVYDDRLEISFGTMLDIEYKIKMFKKLIDENKISQEETGVLDATKGGEIVYKRH